MFIVSEAKVYEMHKSLLSLGREDTKILVIFSKSFQFLIEVLQKMHLPIRKISPFHAFKTLTPQNKSGIITRTFLLDKGVTRRSQECLHEY